MISAWTHFSPRRRLRDCDSVGDGIRLEGPLHVENAGRMSVGNRVHVRSTPAISHLVTGRAGDLQIGDGVFIGHGAAIACHESIQIGADAHIGPFAMIMDTDFHEAGKHDSSGSTGAIVIGPRAKLGARVTVLRGSTIGADAVVAAGSVVKGHIPAGAHVAGVPARIAGVREPEAAGRTVSIDAVCDVVARTFGLATPPHPGATRDDIAQWDSLGMLNLLLSLEQEFDVNIGNESMARVETVSDLLPLLETAALAPA
jgi:acetyltransferase-like isoleucine patch superfamily enzyme/acyl carrier protein